MAGYQLFIDRFKKPREVILPTENFSTTSSKLKRLEKPRAQTEEQRQVSSISCLSEIHFLARCSPNPNKTWHFCAPPPLDPPPPRGRYISRGSPEDRTNCYQVLGQRYFEVGVAVPLCRNYFCSRENSSVAGRPLRQTWGLCRQSGELLDRSRDISF